MTVLAVRLSTMKDIRSRFVSAGNLAISGDPMEGKPSVEFSSYEDLHRILAPLRLAIVKALAGQGRSPSERLPVGSGETYRRFTAT